jgi:inorganic pyrophosphatase
MEDEKGKDEKILSVPVEKVDLFYKDIHDISDISIIQLKQIEHFFTHYKDLESDKFVKILGWENKKKAIDLILSHAIAKPI